MDKKDKTIVCKDCGAEFTFTVGEQEFYEEKGFTNEPARCKECRDKKRNGNRNSNFNSSRPVYRTDED
ncbi:MAG: zinc-ribbon domain-containing protein [Bacilli bacterium]